ncbi:POLR3D family protein [Megaselia abdita]
MSNGTTPVNVKKDPGAPNGLSETSGSSVHLSSFGLPRDLSLGGSLRGGRGGGGAVSKKVFVPNLNAVRNKNTNVKTSKDTSMRGRRGGGKGERGRGGKAGGRGNNLIQTTGVFSEGAGDGALKKSLSFRSSYGDDSPSPSQMRRPTINKNLDNKIDVKAEAQNLREFLGDSDEDFDYNQKTDLDTTIPIKLSNEPTKISSQSDQRYPVDVNELISRTTAQILLLQLPDSLPCVGDEDEEPAKPKEEGGAEEEPETKKTYLRHLNEGQIGKLVRYKSGKCKLLLGDTSFNVELGMESGFLQDLMSVTTNREERSGNMINLGPIQAKLSATPDWEFLLEKSISSASSSPSSS